MRVVAHPIELVARLIGDHPGVANSVFALIQVLLGLGIAWRPTVALGTGRVRCLVARGSGGSARGWRCLQDDADPLGRAPGAALLYAITAVVLWPSNTSQRRNAPVAERASGLGAARFVWLGLWAFLAAHLMA